MLFATSSLQDSSSRFFLSSLQEGHERCNLFFSAESDSSLTPNDLLHYPSFIVRPYAHTLTAHQTPQRERRITKSVTRARDSFYGFGGSKRFSQAMSSFELCHILATSSKNPFPTCVKGRDPCEDTPLSIESDDSHKHPRALVL
ncbi:hypothetical protein Hypma_007635 [Hypsizygus marmoreus]|uniref:Uncharacterized protein n=1 Tax=Hypsizygus marmoreus TaxID=39966 RepID=A0A369JWF4_HYPMA|nr:hypothetical protein Hypma_007635 [Hypsizygus marmoreus]